MTRGRAAVTLALAFAAAAGPARADRVDPTVPKVVAVGAPRGAAPSDRVDGGRTGRARSRLPQTPNELWSHHVSGGVEHPALVDEAGDVLVALSVPDLVKLSHDGGKEVWRARLGTQATAAPPVIASGGLVVVVTAGGQAIGVSPSGSVRFTTPLGSRLRDIDAAPLALRDGGVAIAAGRSLLELDDGGAIRARAAFDDKAVGALIEGPDGILATGATGTVWIWRPPAPPRKLGTFGGPPHRGAALADARTLLAVVDFRRLVAFDLASGVAHVRTSIAPGGSFLDGPPAVGAGGLAYVATQAGLVAAIDAIGNERLHAFAEKPVAPLAPAPGTPPGAVFLPPIESKPSPPLVVDPAGRVAFTRIGGRTGVVAPDGTIALAAERVCGLPVGISPAGAKRFVVTCRDGGVFLFGE